jgi:hypothetical protein
LIAYGEKTELFTCGSIDRVILMSDCTHKNWLTQQRSNIEPVRGEYVELENDLIANDDLLMEQILDNMNGTPLGQVLKKIAVMPEVRKQKVLTVRRQLTEGRYNLTDRLDLALEKVLDDLNI